MRRNIFETIVECIGAIEIFLSSFVIGLLLAFIVYFSFPTSLNIILSWIIFGIGIVFGVFFATKMYKSKRGTMDFISRTSTTPELDNLEEHQNDSR